MVRSIVAEYIKNTVHMERVRRGMTQEELAEKAGVTRQTIISIEKGSYTPSVLLALKIAAAFKLPVGNIFKIAHEK